MDTGVARSSSNNSFCCFFLCFALQILVSGYRSFQFPFVGRLYRASVLCMTINLTSNFPLFYVFQPATPP